MGVPLIGRPFFAGQHVVGRLVESIWKDSLQVEGGKLMTKSGLVKSLKLILGQKNEQGKKIREGAKALEELVLKAYHGPNSIYSHSGFQNFGGFDFYNILIIYIRSF